MRLDVILNLGGILLQVGAAGFLVWKARQTYQSLTTFKITYDDFNRSLNTLKDEVQGQFHDQAAAFAVLAIGAAMQAVAVLLE